MQSKLCKKCNTTKPVPEFGFITSKNKHHSYCKLCVSNISSQYREKYKHTQSSLSSLTCTKCDTTKDISEFHKDNSTPTGYHYNCKTCRNTKIKKDRDVNKEYCNERHRQWTKTPNGQRCIKNQKFKNNIRTRILKALKHNYKRSSTTELIGCSIKHLKEHLQQTALNNGYSKFNINDYSGKEYHIDHIIPCSAFNLEDPEEQKKCFNYKNMQILTSQENLIKHDTIILTQ